MIMSGMLHLGSKLDFVRLLWYDEKKKLRYKEWDLLNKQKANKRVETKPKRY